jgi:hypothetical protein
MERSFVAGDAESGPERMIAGAGDGIRKIGMNGGRELSAVSLQDDDV